MFKFLIAFLAFLAAGPAWSQVDGQTCVNLAKTIATGYSRSFTSDQFSALEWYRNCEATSGNDANGVTLGYEGFNIGVQWSAAKQQQFCTDEYKDKFISREAYSSVKTVFAEALAPITECLRLASNSWQINYQSIGKDSISVTVSNSNGTGNFISGVDIIPPDAMNCSGIPQKFPITIKTGPEEILSIVCTRQPKSQTVDGVAFTSSEDAALDLQLANQPFILPLPGYKSSIWGDIDGRIHSSLQPLSDSLISLKTDLSAWAGPSENGGNQIGSGDYRGETVCPAGQYAVGMKWWGAPAAIKMCIGCAYGIQIVCRPLNVPK